MKKQDLINQLETYHSCFKQKYTEDDYYKGFCDALHIVIDKLEFLEIKESLLKDIYANLRGDKE
jgi:hypothetical protein